MEQVARSEAGPHEPAERLDVLFFIASICALFVPVFLFTVWRGEPLHVLHYTDENLHLGLVRAFSSGKFAIDWTYSSATTPLFHLTLAAIDGFTGGNRWFLRGFNLGITLLLAVLVFRDLRRVTPRWDAWLISWALLATPYVGSRGMVLLTENYSYLWFWLAARPWLLSQSMPSVRATVLSAVFLSLAALTRQNWLWACPWMMAMAMVRHPVSWRRGALHALAFLLPVAVCLPFFVAWKGLVPQVWHGVNQSDVLHPKAIAFAFVLLGTYVVVLSPSHLLRRRDVLKPSIALVLATVLGLLSRLHHESLFLDSGFVWFVSDRFPTLAGANTLLVVLAAIGMLELVDAVKGDRWEYACYLAIFAASFAFVRLCFQKYYEFPLLLALLVGNIVHPVGRLDRLGRLVWIALGVAYLLSKVRPPTMPLLGGA